MRDVNDEQDLADKATAAFQATVNLVINKARETHTPIIVWQDGAVVAIPVEKFAANQPSIQKPLS